MRARAKVAARGACRERARLGIIADYNAEILEVYWRVGFYVFTGVLTADELADLEADVAAPSDEGSVRSSRGSSLKR